MGFKSMLAALVLCFTIVCTPGADASTPAYFDITCPVDGTKFTIVEAGSMTIFGQRADLSLMGLMGTGYYGVVHTCPKCHFSGTHKDFTQSLSEDLKQKVQREFATFLPGKDLSELTEIDFALQMYVWQGRSALEIAELALVGSYLSIFAGLVCHERAA